jgi:hypothetical protein
MTIPTHLVVRCCWPHRTTSETGRVALAATRLRTARSIPLRPLGPREPLLFDWKDGNRVENGAMAH